MWSLWSLVKHCIAKSWWEDVSNTHRSWFGFGFSKLNLFSRATWQTLQNTSNKIIQDEESPLKGVHIIKVEDTASESLSKFFVNRTGSGHDGWSGKRHNEARYQDQHGWRYASGKRVNGMGKINNRGPIKANTSRVARMWMASAPVAAFAVAVSEVCGAWIGRATPPYTSMLGAAPPGFTASWNAALASHCQHSTRPS